MELSGQEEEMPLPLNSAYGGHAHLIHHRHDGGTVSNTIPQIPSNGNNGHGHSFDHRHHEDHAHTPFSASNKKAQQVVRYKECLKNHAAAMGGNAIDGCGEFMPGGEEGTIEALTCSACSCHRNFHRKEIEGQSCIERAYGARRLMLPHTPHHHQKVTPFLQYPSSRAPVPHNVIMPFGGSHPYMPHSDQSDDQEEGGGVMVDRPPHQQQTVMKKRFRTKFTQEQKEKMLNFAEKVGWKIQRQEESVVQQFCQEIGVKRRVLKVWMHNNKHNLAKKENNSNTTTTANTNTNITLPGNTNNSNAGTPTITSTK